MPPAFSWRRARLPGGTVVSRRGRWRRRRRDRTRRWRARHAGLLVVAAVFVVVAAAEGVVVDVGADAASHEGARLLIEAEVDPAVDARIVDVVGHLRELGVVEGHVRNARVRQRDVMAFVAKYPTGYRARRVAPRRVGRRIARETGGVMSGVHAGSGSVFGLPS